MLEREVKIRFADPDRARAGLAAIGAARLRPRRLQDDALYDTSDGALRARRSVLRLRCEPDSAFLTFKGPVQPGAMKVREEHETTVGDPDVLRRMLTELGYSVWFRYQKYREEFEAPGVTIALDETPVGTFLELEGAEAGILEVAAALGLTPADFLLDSYRGLFTEYARDHGLTSRDMLFETPETTGA
jgi:adenylate cyclase, class 2